MATPLVLIGLPGSGKSTLARAVADCSGRPLFVVDDLIEEDAGLSIPEIFERHGEPHFRRLESAVLERIVTAETAAVIDGGGGLVLAPGNRTLLRRHATVVWLDADDEILLERIGDGAGRPLLAGGPRERLRELRRERLGAYTTAADAIVATGALTDEQAGAEAVLAAAAEVETGEQAALSAVTAAATTTEQASAGQATAVGGDGPGRVLVERVELDGGRGYEIHVGRGALSLLPTLIPERSKRVAIITQPGIGVEVRTGRDQEVFEVPDGEAAKRLEIVGELCSAMAKRGFTRADTVVSVGGGVVSDLAGFVAASYHRGIAVLHCPTTLLGQIDAAIGGKCGVNLPEGKNLVGAFWQPEAVVCDIDALDTLPPREFRSGMGELAKYHFLGGGRLDEVELVERVARSARIKAEVVSGDEREGGRRAILNYGHTLAHALETAGSYDIRHGEAVGVGLVYAAQLAHRLGRIDADRVAEHRRVVAAYGLDADLPAGSDPDQLIELFGRDKKAVTGITFVLDGPNGVEPVGVEDRAILASAFESMGRS